LPWQPGVKTAAGDWSGLQDKISKLTAGNSTAVLLGSWTIFLGDGQYQQDMI